MPICCQGSLRLVESMSETLHNLGWTLRICQERHVHSFGKLLSGWLRVLEVSLCGFFVHASEQQHRFGKDILLAKDPMQYVKNVRGSRFPKSRG